MAQKVQKGSWVRIKKTILEKGKRTGRLPEETRAVPFEMWDKGRLLQDAAIGGEVTIQTRTGRFETGELVEVDPQYELNYGDFVPELLRIGDDARALLAQDGGEDR